MKNTTKLFKAVSDFNRLRILKALQSKILCVCEIKELLQLANSTVSQHLKVLKKNDIVDGVKKGYFMHYSVNTSKIESAIKILLDVIPQNKTKLEN